jgi:hypothetical protein
VKVLIERPIEKRMFPNWSMGFKEIDQPNFEAVNVILGWSKKLNSAEAKSTITKKVTEFLSEFQDDIQAAN